MVISVIDTANLNFVEYLREFEAIFENALTRESGARDTVPLSKAYESFVKKKIGERFPGSTENYSL
jgi:hypothetical protein